MSEAPTLSALTRATFDAEFRRFTARCAAIIGAHPASKTGAGPHAALVCLNQYLSIYSRTEPAEHFAYFETFFNKNRAAVLGVLEDDTWLRDGAHFIQYGEGARVTSKQLEERLRQSRILLSAIYRLACELREAANKRLDTGEDLGGSWDLVYPKIFLYHLYKVLTCNCTTADRERLFAVVEELAVDLAIIEPKARPAEAAPAEAAPAAMPDLSAMMAKMMQSIMPAVGGAAAVPEAVTSNIMSNLLQSPVVKETMEDVVSQASQNADWADIVGGIFSKFQQPEALQALQATLANPETNAFVQSAVSGSAPGGTGSASGSPDDVFGEAV